MVFDEVHFGKFISGYIRGTYFFDIHPPAGKLLRCDAMRCYAMRCYAMLCYAMLCDAMLRGMLCDAGKLLIAGFAYLGGYDGLEPLHDDDDVTMSYLCIIM